MQDCQGIRPYRTIAGEGTSELTVEKSRFLGFVYPVTSEAEALERLSALRKKYWDARHICHAFRIGYSGGLARSSDDGEPSGTAGAPILNVLTQTQTQNALCAVVRYFGGVLLGAGGLTRTYGKTASAALANAGSVEMRVCSVYRVSLSYASYAALETTLRSSCVSIEPHFSDLVTIRCVCAEELSGALVDTLVERTSGEANVALVERGLFADYALK